MKQLEGFQYVAALHINMGYYTVRLFPDRQDTTTIVTAFGEFRCNYLLTALCASGYIFQAKVEKLLGDIKGVKNYIDDILVLSRD